MLWYVFSPFLLYVYKNDMYIYLGLFKAKIRSPSTRACDIMLWSDSHKVAAKSGSFFTDMQSRLSCRSRYSSLLVIILVSSLVLGLLFMILLCCFSVSEQTQYLLYSY